MQKSIFVVDNNEANLFMAGEMLKNQFTVETMTSASAMFKLLETKKPDLILMDIEMPEMDGFEALLHLKENHLHSDIPVILITGMIDALSQVRGFQLGAVDFITKPFSEQLLLNRIKIYLNINELVIERTAKLQEKINDLQNLQNSIVYVASDMIENRDKGTGGHVDRTIKYLKILIDAMLARGVYANELHKLDLEAFYSSSRLHDLGKSVIPNSVLNKPGKLTNEEFEVMKTHAIEGERIIDKIITLTGSNIEFLNYAKLFAGSHHERWDGKGYPRGLDRTNIPIQGRIMSIIDVYDALVSERPYKKPFTPEEAAKIIMDSTGEMFDPLIAETFFEVRDRFDAIEKT
ncbi:MAG: response regulator [Treponema sp.]|nr:response regulator [Treponema sp.]